MPLHPVVAKIWDLQKTMGAPPLWSLPVEEARKAFSAVRRALGEGPELASVTDRTVHANGHSVRGRLYVPAENLAGLCVYFHGGGWTLGALDDFEALVRTLAQRSDCAVFSVDYRLAPEHPFPAAIEDARTALRWASAEGLAELGLGPGLIVAGDSAGGNLAAVAALELGRELDIRLQVLFNPCLDLDPGTESYARYGEGYLLTGQDMAWFVDTYAAGADRMNPLLAPLHWPDLSQAPAAWIGVAEFDVLRSEAEAFAARMRAAGRRVELRHCEGVMHGFARLHNHVDVADQAVDAAAGAMRAAFRGNADG